LNTVLKAAVNYCGLPDRRQAKRLLPWLRPAIDNSMMKYLQRRYRDEFPRGIKAISDVDKRSYFVLRNLAARDAVENLGGELHPVQWEDIVWLEVNGKTWPLPGPGLLCFVNKGRANVDQGEVQHTGQDM